MPYGAYHANLHLAHELLDQSHYPSKNREVLELDVPGPLSDAWAVLPPLRKGSSSAAASSFLGGRIKDAVQPTILQRHSPQGGGTLVSTCSIRGKTPSSFMMGMLGGKPDPYGRTSDHFMGSDNVTFHQKTVDERPWSLKRIARAMANYAAAFLESVFGPLSPAMMIKIMLIVALIATRMLLHALVKGAPGAMAKAAAAAKTAASAAGGAIASGASAAGAAIATGAAAAGAAVASGAAAAGEAIGKGAVAAGKAMKAGAKAFHKGVESAGEAMTKGFAAAGRGLKKGLEAAGRGIGKGMMAASRAADKARHAIGKGMRNAQKGLEKFGKGLVKGIGKAAKAMHSGLEKFGAGLTAGVLAAGSLIHSGLTHLNNGLHFVADKFSEFKPLKALGSMAGGLMAGAAFVGAGLVSAGKAIGKGASKAWEGMKAAGRGMWKAAKFVGGAMAGAYKALDNAVKAMSSGILSVMNGDIGGIMGKVGKYALIAGMGLLLLGGAALLAVGLLGARNKVKKHGRMGMGKDSHLFGNGPDFKRMAKERAAAREGAERAEEAAAEAKANAFENGGKRHCLPGEFCPEEQHDQESEDLAVCNAWCSKKGLGAAIAVGAGAAASHVSHGPGGWDDDVPEDDNPHECECAGVVVVGEKDNTSTPDVETLAQATRRERPDPRDGPDSMDAKPGAPHGDLQPVRPDPKIVLPVQEGSGNQERDQSDLEKETSVAEKEKIEKVKKERPEDTEFVVISQTRHLKREPAVSFEDSDPTGQELDEQNADLDEERTDIGEVTKDGTADTKTEDEPDLEEQDLARKTQAEDIRRVEQVQQRAGLPSEGHEVLAVESHRPSMQAVGERPLLGHTGPATLASRHGNRAPLQSPLIYRPERRSTGTIYNHRRPMTKLERLQLDKRAALDFAPNAKELHAELELKSYPRPIPTRREVYRHLDKLYPKVPENVAYRKSSDWEDEETIKAQEETPKSDTGLGSKVKGLLKSVALKFGGDEEHVQKLYPEKDAEVQVRPRSWSHSGAPSSPYTRRDWERMHTFQEQRYRAVTAEQNRRAERKAEEAKIAARRAHRGQPEEHPCKGHLLEPFEKRGGHALMAGPFDENSVTQDTLSEDRADAERDFFPEEIRDDKARRREAREAEENAFLQVSISHEGDEPTTDSAAAPASTRRTSFFWLTSPEESSGERHLESSCAKPKRELFPLYYLDHNGEAKDFLDPSALRPAYRRFKLNIFKVGTMFLQVPHAQCREDALPGRAAVDGMATF